MRFTLGFLGVMFAANWAVGGLWRDLPPAALARWGISHDDLARGEVWRLLTANFLSKHPRMLLDQISFTLCIIGWFEWRHGSLRAFAMFFVTNTAGFLLTLFWVVGMLKAVFNRRSAAFWHVSEVDDLSGRLDDWHRVP